jgi:hypothetical protein
MSITLIQSKNQEIIDIMKDIPDVLNIVYEKVRTDNYPFANPEYIGIPKIMVESGHTIHDTLNLSVALCQTVGKYILRNPGFIYSDTLCSCINTISSKLYTIYRFFDRLVE